jgi:hypothetical protein
VADEAASWDDLHAKFETKRINHSEAYSNGTTSTNMAESFFSRLRRAEVGTHHHISGRYLGMYASEMAWREDNRRKPNGELCLEPSLPPNPIGGVRCAPEAAGTNPVFKQGEQLCCSIA